MSQLLRPRSIVVGGFFLLLILMGIWIHRDHGISTDEPTNRITGMVNLRYAAQRLAPAWAAQESAFAATPDLATFVDRDHGPMMEMAMAVVGRLLAHGDTVAYYYWRHLFLFCTFVVGVGAVYRIGLLRFGDWRWALLASALLVLSPRLFADAFYNSSDIGLLAAFTLGIYTLLRLLRTPGWRTAAVHGLVTAIAIDIRVVGLLLVVLTGVMVVLEILTTGAGNRSPRKPLLWAGFWYFIVAAGATVLLWPFLWEAPMDNFLYAFQRMSRFPWQGSNLYFGRLILRTELPWHYAPAWIILTTPLPYVLTGLFAIGYWGWQLTRNRCGSLSAFTARIDLLLICWFVGPIVLIILLQSVIYNGWRHLYFIYPAFVLLAVRGVQLLTIASKRSSKQWRILALITLLAAGLEIGRTFVRMIRMHPYQQVYFSFLPAAAAEQLFDRDYWGLSYQQGLRWLLKYDTRSQIAYHTTAARIVYNNRLLLQPSEDKRLHYRDSSEPADYFITSYRLHPQPYPTSIGKEVYCIYADGIKILSIFQYKAHP